MIRFGAWLGGSAALPTSDLYFLAACRPWLRRWWRRGGWRRGGWRRIAPNCFVAGETMLLIRRDSEAVMARALSWPGRLIYLVDDDIAAAADCPYLDADYRARSAQFFEAFHRPLLRRADALAVPAETLRARFAADPDITASLHPVDPYWPLSFADQRHFDVLDHGGTLRIVHLGSGSHGAALAAIVPAIRHLLDAQPDIHFSYFAARPLDPALEAHPRARRIAPKSWPEYRRWLARQRFHLALYPLMASTFDRARSLNKLLEHAVIGAVGVYPEDWEPARAAGDGAIYAPADPAKWAAALTQAIAERRALATMAARAAQALAGHGDPDRQRAQWRSMEGRAIEGCAILGIAACPS